MIRFFLSAFVLMIMGSLVHAGESCSSFKQVCLASGGMDSGSNMKICTDAANACKARCKAGNKLFVAPNGQVHPVTSCD